MLLPVRRFRRLLYRLSIPFSSLLVRIKVRSRYLPAQKRTCNASPPVPRASRRAAPPNAKKRLHYICLAGLGRLGRSRRCEKSWAWYCEGLPSRCVGRDCGCLHIHFFIFTRRLSFSEEEGRCCHYHSFTALHGRKTHMTCTPARDRSLMCEMQKEADDCVDGRCTTKAVTPVAHWWDGGISCCLSLAGHGQ